MANIYFSNVLHNLTILGCATSIAVAPISAAPVLHKGSDFCYSDVMFLNRINEITERIEEYAENLDCSGAISALFDLKDEVESYLGSSADLGTFLDMLKEQFFAASADFDDVNWQIMRDFFTQMDSRHEEYKSACQSAVTNKDFDSIIALKRKVREDDSAEVKAFASMFSTTLTVGVTMGLCGLFLFFIPIPGFQAVGAFLMEAGGGLAAGYAIGQYSEQRRKKQCVQYAAGAEA